MNRLTKTDAKLSRWLFYAGVILIGTAALSIGTIELARHLGQKAPVAVSGCLDLRGWAFGASPSVPLVGEWRFLPEALAGKADFDSAAPGTEVMRRVPDFRGSAPKAALAGAGQGTYRLRVLLPAGAEGLALRYSAIRTAFELEVDGAVLARVGSPSLDPSRAEPAFAPGIVGIDGPGSGLDIIVRVSNHEARWGGMAKPIVLGEKASLVREKSSEDLWTFIIVGALIGIALNSSIVYAFRRRESAYLFFAFFAAVVALRALVVDDALISAIFPSIGYDGLARLGCASIFLLFPSGALFFYRLFPEDIGRRGLGALLAPSLAFAFLVPWAPLAVLSWSILPYALVAIVSLFLGFALFCVRPALQGRPASGIILAAGTFLLAAAISTAFYTIVIVKGEVSFPLGLPLFVIIQTIALAKRFTVAFDRVEALSGELASANARLEREIGLAADVRGRLEEAVADKGKLLQEVHHRVKNSLQIVSSIINLQAHRTSDASALEAYKSVVDRIRAISGVHDTLYGFDSERRVALGTYARELIRQFTTFHGEGVAEVELLADEVAVPMDLCIELGLALTELLSNAYRYAVVPSGSGTIRVELRREDAQVVLVVADDGPGFPSDFVPGASTTSGFKIITSLARQRMGSYSVSSGPGAIVTVRFPLAAERAA